MYYLVLLYLLLISPWSSAHAETTTGHVGGCTAEHMEQAEIDELIALHVTEEIEKRQEPKDKAVSYVNRAQCYARKGNANAAIADLTRAIELDSTWHLPYYQRAELYRAAGQTEKAIADYKDALLRNNIHAETKAALKALGAFSPPLGGGGGGGGGPNPFRGF